MAKRERRDLAWNAWGACTGASKALKKADGHESREEKEARGPGRKSKK